MSNVTQTSTQNITATLGGATNIEITNFAITTINSEVSHNLKTNLKELIVRAREAANIKLSFVSGESGTKYLTVFKGTALSLSNISFTAKVLYFQSDKVGTVEIVELY